MYAIVFLICISKAYLLAMTRKISRHREWMIRAYAVGLGVATTRPIVGAFFAFRRLTPHEFFGIAFWLGFTTTFMIAEAWIDYTRWHDHYVEIQSLDSAIAGRTKASPSPHVHELAEVPQEFAGPIEFREDRCQILVAHVICHCLPEDLAEVRG